MAAVRDFLRAALPTGQMLPEEAWGRRHRAILAVLWLHVPLLLIVGTLAGHGFLHSISEALVITPLAAAATGKRFSPAIRASFATLGLVTSSAILVHFSEGLVEMHFHFFVMVAVVTLYQLWTPFLLAIAFVVLHHGLVGIMDPTQVYNHPEAIADPVTWAVIHGAFIAAASAAGLTAWKLNERGLESERGVRNDLLTANAELAEAQSMARIGSWDWNIVQDEVWWSEELYRIFGLSHGALSPSYDAFLSTIHEDDQARVRAIIEGSIKDLDDFDYRSRIVRPDGDIRVIHALGRATSGPDGSLIRIGGTVQDITERAALEEQVHHQAFHDSLTGLANRALFLDRVDHALARQERLPTSLAVFSLDLDDFKTVNDSMGHRIGDDLLLELATQIEHVLRPSDTFARLGGDEFAILLEDLSDDEDAIAVTTRILDLFAQPIQLEEAELLIGTSIGIAFSDKVTEATTEEILKCADTAMYAAKRQGKGSYEIFEEGMAETAVDRLKMKSDLRRAIREEEFLLHYQPIVRLDSGEVTGVEALVRWMHPERGLVPPLDFIPLAEETGFILPLTSWVLREACRTATEWVGVKGDPITVAVNISAGRFHHPGLENELEETLKETGLAPERLTLEITESVFLQDAKEVAERLTNLKQLGVQLAIDDFGIGYSSLSYLRDLPIDLLKVDKSFIDSIALGVEESALARAIIKLGRTLGLKVVAEGVEEPEQAELLEQLECEYGQGYLFSKPVAPALIDELLGRRPAGARLIAS